MFRRFRRGKAAETSARRLYEAIVERSRAPVFHTELGVSDSIDGRFDLLVLHLYLVLARLREEGEAGAELASALTNLAFAAFEEALRELGVGDTGMARRVKAMANAFFGRLDAYLTAGNRESELAAALLRNLYRGDSSRIRDSASMARYAIAARGNLRAEGAAGRFLQGLVDFGPLPQV
jgi:cytochrome b pre-mRNA-processing protein 3